MIFLRITCGSGQGHDDEDEKVCNAEEVEGEFGAIYSEAAQSGWRGKVCLWATQRTVGADSAIAGLEDASKELGNLTTI